MPSSIITTSSSSSDKFTASAAVAPVLLLFPPALTPPWLRLVLADLLLGPTAPPASCCKPLQHNKKISQQVPVLASGDWLCLLKECSVWDTYMRSKTKCSDCRPSHWSPLKHHVQRQRCYQAADTPSCVLASFIEHSKHQSKHLQHCQLF